MSSTSVIADPNGAKLGENLYKPWGEDRYTWGTAATTFGFTGQRAERGVAGGLYYYNDRWYDSYITQFTQPDTIIPDPYNPLDWNRYSYARYNPVKYTDPTGHWPDWFDYAMGAGSQFVNDMTFGLFYALTVDPENIDNAAYQEGREAGRAAATVVSSAEMVLGTAAVAWGLGSMTPTAGGGLAAALPTGGTSLVIAGVAIPAEAAVAGAGAFAAGHGFSSMVYMRNHPMLGENGPQFTSKTLWQGKEGRLDVENPNPGNRPGQIHFQQGKNKWIYDPATNSFSPARGTKLDPPGWLNDFLGQNEFQNAIEKGLRYLGK